MDYLKFGLDKYLQPLSGNNNEYVSPFEFDYIYERGAVNQNSILFNAIDNAKIRNSYRAYNAVVSSIVGDGDYVDIQTAIDSLVNANEGGIILIRPGTYKPEAPITLGNNITLIGVDPTNCIIDFTNAGDVSSGCIKLLGTVITSDGTVSITNGDATVSGVSTEFSTDGVSSGDYIYLNGVEYTVDSVTNDTSLELTEVYRGASDSGLSYKILQPTINSNIKNLSIINGLEASTTGPGIFIDDSSNISIENCIVNNCDTGLSIEWVYDAKIENCEFKNNTNYGINVTFAVTSYITKNICSNNTLSGIRISATFGKTNVIVDGCVSNGNGSHGYHLNACTHVIFDNCCAIGNNTHGFYLQGAQYNFITAGIARENGTDGIHATNLISVNSEYNNFLNNNCSNNGDDGIELTSGTNANNASHNILQGNGGTNVVDGGTNNEVWDNI